MDTSKKQERLREEREVTKEKLDKALREKEEIERQLSRAENRANYLKDGERKERTHRLCIKGAVIEALLPDVVNFSEQDFYSLMEEVFAIPEAEEMIKVRIAEWRKEQQLV